MIRKSLFAAILIFSGAGRVRSQEGAPRFDVASIKPDTSSSPQRFSLFPEFRAQNATLKDLITLAYEVNGLQISGGPSWIDSSRFKISAKVAGPPTPGREALMQQRRRLKALLQDRFKLTVHRETRKLPIYELTVAKGGPRLRATACTEMDPKNPGPAPGKTILDYCGSSGFFKGRFEASSANMGDLAKALANLLDRFVVDRTGISGTFHVQLTFASDDGAVRTPAGLPENPGNLPAPPELAPNIFTALQEQLGLKLGSSKGPVEILVIDLAEKPSEN